MSNKKKFDSYELYIRENIQKYKDYKFLYNVKKMTLEFKNHANAILSNPKTTPELKKITRKWLRQLNKILKEISNVIHYAKVESDRAVTIIYENYKKLMFKWINRYKKSRRDLRDSEDLYSSALIAYTKALDGFDLSRSIKFSTFLTNGLRNELIGCYRKLVRQAEVEPCNTTEYFYKNDKEIEFAPSDSILESDNINNVIQTESTMLGDCFNILQESEEKLRVSEFIRNIDTLTLEESLYFILIAGIENSQYSKKEIKKLFNLSDSYLEGGRLKVFRAYQESINN